MFKIKIDPDHNHYQHIHVPGICCISQPKKHTNMLPIQRIPKITWKTSSCHSAWPQPATQLSQKSALAKATYAFKYICFLLCVCVVQVSLPLLKIINSRVYSKKRFFFCLTPVKRPGLAVGLGIDFVFPYHKNKNNNKSNNNNPYQKKYREETSQRSEIWHIGILHKTEHFNPTPNLMLTLQGHFFHPKIIFGSIYFWTNIFMVKDQEEFDTEDPSLFAKFF